MNSIICWCNELIVDERNSWNQNIILFSSSRVPCLGYFNNLMTHLTRLNAILYQRWLSKLCLKFYWYKRTLSLRSLCVYALVYEKPYINVFGLLISAPMNCFSSEVLWNNMEFIILYVYKMFNADIILNSNEMF